MRIWVRFLFGRIRSRFQNPYFRCKGKGWVAPLFSLLDVLQEYTIVARPRLTPAVVLSRGNRVLKAALSALLIISMALPTHFANALRPTGLEESEPTRQLFLQKLRGNSTGLEENNYRISVDTGVNGLMRADNRAGYLTDFRDRISAAGGLLWNLNERQPSVNSEERARVMTVGSPGSVAGPVYGFVRYRIVRPFADDPSRMAILIEDLGVDPKYADQLTERGLINLVKANVTLWRPVVLARVPLVSSQSRILRDAGFVSNGQEDAEENILMAYGGSEWTSKPMNLESVASEQSVDLLPMAGYAIRGDSSSEQSPTRGEWSWSGVAQTQWPQLLQILNEGRTEGQAAFTYEDLVYLQSDRQVSSMVLYPSGEPDTIAAVILYNHEQETHRIIAFGVGQNFRGQGLGQYLLELFKDQALTETRPNADVSVRLDTGGQTPVFFRTAGFTAPAAGVQPSEFLDTGDDAVSMGVRRIDPEFLAAMTRAGFTNSGQEELPRGLPQGLYDSMNEMNQLGVTEPTPMQIVHIEGSSSEVADALRAQLGGLSHPAQRMNGVGFFKSFPLVTVEITLHGSYGQYPREDHMVLIAPAGWILSRVDQLQRGQVPLELYPYSLHFIVFPTLQQVYFKEISVGVREFAQDRIRQLHGMSAWSAAVRRLKQDYPGYLIVAATTNPMTKISFPRVFSEIPQAEQEAAIQAVEPTLTTDIISPKDISAIQIRRVPPVNAGQEEGAVLFEPASFAVKSRTLAIFTPETALQGARALQFMNPAQRTRIQVAIVVSDREQQSLVQSQLPDFVDVSEWVIVSEYATKKLQEHILDLQISAWSRGADTYLVETSADLQELALFLGMPQQYQVNYLEWLSALSAESFA